MENEEFEVLLTQSQNFSSDFYKDLNRNFWDFRIFKKKQENLRINFNIFR